MRDRHRLEATSRGSGKAGVSEAWNRGRHQGCLFPVPDDRTNKTVPISRSVPAGRRALEI
jgi:hypothetical protein